jgi:HAD-superfamily hydrolase, subfamily IA, variant 1 family protein
LANKTPILVFDLDDTLYSKQQVFLTALKKCYPTFKTDIDVYKVYREKSEIAFELFTKGQITLEKNHLSRVEGTLSALGLDSSKESVIHFKETYQYVMDHIELDEDWYHFFDKVSNHSTLVLLTNGPTSHQSKKITSLGLKKWFQPSKVFISETTGVPKPQAEAFMNVERLFPDVSRNDFWMIGDDLTNDIEGAKNRYWNTIYFKFGEKKSDVNPKPLSNPKELLLKLEKEALISR